MRKYKCQRCKELIEPEELIETANKKRYHRQCKADLDREKNEWDGLYQYLLKTYFAKELPPRFIGDLKKYRALYTFQQIHDCYINIEEQLQNYVFKINFNSTSHKGAYLFSALKNHIELFIENQIKENLKSSTSKIISKSKTSETSFQFQNPNKNNNPFLDH